MGYNFNLIDPYMPFRACGASLGAEVAGAAVSGLFGAFSSSAQSSSAAARQAAQNRWQEQENAKNRDWQSDEADKARAWQTNEREEQQNWQYGEFTRQANMNYTLNKDLMKQSNADAYKYWLAQQQYNTPQQQVQRAAEAGLNPSAMAGLGTFGGTGLQAATPSVSTPSVSSPSAPSASLPSGSANSAGIVPVVDSLAKGLSSIGSFVGSLAKSGLDKKNTEVLSSQASALIREQLAKADTAETVSAIQRVEQFVAEQTKDDRIKKAWADYKKAHAEALLADDQGHLAAAQEQTEMARKNFYNSIRELNMGEYNKVVFDVAHLQERFEKEMHEASSRIAANYGSAAAGHASANLNNALAVEQKWYNAARLTPESAEEAKDAFIATLREQCVKAGITGLNFEMLQYAESNQEIDWWFDKAIQTEKAVGDAINTAVNMRKGNAMAEYLSRQGYGQTTTTTHTRYGRHQSVTSTVTTPNY